MLTMTEEREKLRSEALETLRAGLFYFRARGFTAWEIARKLTHGLRPGQMWETVATLKAIGEADVADEARRCAEQAEREAEEAERERRKLARVDTYYICGEDGVVLDIVERVPYACALFRRDDTAEQFGVAPEALDVLTKDEYESEYGAGA